MRDDESPSSETGSSSRALSVREEQAAFGTSAGAISGYSHFRPWPGRPVDAALIEHSQAAVDRLTILIEDAVRGADDDAVARLDRALQVAERLLALAWGETEG